MTVYLSNLARCEIRLPNTQRCQIPECPDPWQKEVGPATNRRKCRQTSNLFSNGPLGDGHVKRAVLGSEDGIALIPEFVEIWVVRPYIHRELKLADQARATDKRRDSPFP